MPVDGTHWPQCISAPAFTCQRFRVDVEDDLLARKRLTQVRVLLRVLDTVYCLDHVGLCPDDVRRGASIRRQPVCFGGRCRRCVWSCRSAGVSNLIAGVQLALTQPIRLEDAITVQNEYGWIEEINAAYVVIRLWDLRRLIVPLNFFIQQPFYNWTRQAAKTVGSVVLYLDYAAPIDVIRKKAIELVEQTKQDNATVVNVQVTNTSRDAIELRALVDSDSTNYTSICADLREKLITFLHQEHPEALPRRRNEIVGEMAPQKTEPSNGRS